jgi:hypothetical protein
VADRAVGKAVKAAASARADYEEVSAVGGA